MAQNSNNGSHVEGPELWQYLHTELHDLTDP